MSEVINAIFKCGYRVFKHKLYLKSLGQRHVCLNVTYAEENEDV